MAQLPGRQGRAQQVHQTGCAAAGPKAGAPACSAEGCRRRPLQRPPAAPAPGRAGGGGGRAHCLSSVLLMLDASAVSSGWLAMATRALMLPATGNRSVFRAVQLGQTAPAVRPLLKGGVLLAACWRPGGARGLSGLRAEPARGQLRPADHLTVASAIRSLLVMICLAVSAAGVGVNHDVGDMGCLVEDPDAYSEYPCREFSSMSSADQNDCLGKAKWWVNQLQAGVRLTAAADHKR